MGQYLENLVSPVWAQGKKTQGTRPVTLILSVADITNQPQHSYD